MSLNEWITEVCQTLAEFGYTPEMLHRFRFAEHWRQGTTPRAAALLAIKESTQ